MKQIFVYVSGHGFGHAGRSSAVLEGLSRRASLAGGVALHVRTSGRALGFCRALPCVASVTETDVGPGFIQRSPFEIDHDATLGALEAQAARWDATVRAEAGELVERGVDLVYADVPSIAFEIAAEAGVASVGLANFSWSWMYHELAYEHAAYAPFGQLCARAERRATELLRLDLPGGLGHFPVGRDIPPVARRSRRSRAEVRASLGLDAEDPRPVVLVSFGGYGDALDLGTLASHNHGYRFLLVERSRLAHPRDVITVERRDDLPHPDLVAAADCVLSKPGYGTFAECVASGVPLVYVAHRHLPEYPVMVDTIRRYLRHSALTLADFEAGRWSDAIAAAIGAPAPPVAVAASGDEEAVAVLAGYLGV